MVNSSRRRRPMSGQGGGSTGGWSVTSSPVEVTTGDRTVSRRRCLAPVPKASLARLVSTGRDRPDAETARIAGIPAGADAASAIGAQRDTSHVGIVTRMARHIRVHLVASRPGGKGMRMLAAAGDWILEVLVPADQRPPAARRPPPPRACPRVRREIQPHPRLRSRVTVTDTEPPGIRPAAGTRVPSAFPTHPGRRPSSRVSR
jgi:hypothetical protein